MKIRDKDRDAPIVIAGPCSVESRKQLEDCVEALYRAGGVDLVRCGVWKPRTRPGGFEGIGEPALKWMEELQKRYEGVKFCCEVAQPEHIKLCQRYGIEVVWIGARTSGDPFSMGALSAALSGSGMSVLVKNPLTSDVNLWQGAIERLKEAGIEDIAAVHRGFYLYNGSTPYRNTPLWEVPIELRRRMSDLPILCDPSHIGGHKDYLLQIAQTATDLGCDGYMIEVHPHPEDALTDSQQQITPTELLLLLNKIVHRSKESGTDYRIAELRQKIDVIDHLLIQKIGERMQVSQQIATIKEDLNMEVFQPKRWETLLKKRMETAEEQGLDKDFIKSLYEKIHAESVKVQERIIASKGHEQ